MVFYKRDKACDQMEGNPPKALLPNEELRGTFRARITFIIT